MRENLYYLFAAGLLLGSGPCLSFCSPFLVIYTAAQKKGIKQSLISYGIFSFGKILSYMILGVVCALGAVSLQSQIFSRYTAFIYSFLGSFIVLLGVLICLKGKNVFGCAMFNAGNIRNVGVVGFLVGLSPCLPLLGILNYIVLVSHSAFEAAGLTLVFGLGTIFSPVVLLIMVSGKFAHWIDQNKKWSKIFSLLCGTLLIGFGLRILWGIKPSIF